MRHGYGVCWGTGQVVRISGGGLGEVGGGKSSLTNRAYGEEMNRGYKGWIGTSNIREHQGETGNPTVDYNGCAGAFMDEGLTATLIYPGPRTSSRGKIDEGTSTHRRATAVGFAPDPELDRFFCRSMSSCVMVGVWPYLAASGSVTGRVR